MLREQLQHYQLARLAVHDSRRKDQT
jgi:hypothetical protein